MGRSSTHGIQLENAVDSTCALQGERGSRLHIYVSGPIQGLPEGSFKLHVDVALDEFFWSVEARTSQQSVSVSVGAGSKITSSCCSAEIPGWLAGRGSCLKPCALASHHHVERPRGSTRQPRHRRAPCLRSSHLEGLPGPAACAPLQDTPAGPGFAESRAHPGLLQHVPDSQ